MKWGQLSTSGPRAPSPTKLDMMTLTLESGPVLILLALLGALVVGIGLNSFVRWLPCCRGRDEVDLSDDFSLRMAKSDLKALPIIVYSAASKPTPVPTDCPICLAEFAEGEKVRVLPNCNHRFHLECIDAWLVSHSSCPLCRHSLNLHKERRGTSGIVQETEPNNSMEIVIEARDSTQAVGLVSSHTETFQGSPQATVRNSSMLPSPA